MSSPLACAHPASFASRSSLVSRGLYTASNTTSNPPASSADLGTGLASASGTIPTDVVLASTSPRTAPPRRSSMVRATPPHAAASASARSKPRFTTTTFAPSNAAPNAKPRPAPPAPTTTTVLPFSGDVDAPSPSPSPRPPIARSMAPIAAA